MLKDRCPDIAITADCIVGFPGKKTEDFRATMELVERDGLRRGILLLFLAPQIRACFDAARICGA